MQSSNVRPTELSAKILIPSMVDYMFLFPLYVLGLIPVMFGYLGLSLLMALLMRMGNHWWLCPLVVVLAGFTPMQRI